MLFWQMWMQGSICQGQKASFIMNRFRYRPFYLVGFRAGLIIGSASCRYGACLSVNLGCYLHTPLKLINLSVIEAAASDSSFSAPSGYSRTVPKIC